MTLGGTVTSFIMKISCNFCNLSGFFLMTPEQGKGSDPPLFEDYHHAWRSDLASLAWWITETRQQSSGKDANCLFHYRHVMKRMKKKKIGHMDTLL